MSNLSELLPTGGGQNAVDFVASGTLSSGQTVVLRSDGKVEAVAEGGPSSGSPVVFENATSAGVSATFDSNSNKIIIAYRDNGNSFSGTAIVGTVSGTSISFGTPVVFDSAFASDLFATFDSNANKVVIAYADGNNSYYGTAIVGTVSGTSISFGSSVVFESAFSAGMSATFDSTSNKVVISYQDGSNSYYGTAIVGTVSGTSISFGTPTVFESANSGEQSATFDSNSNKIVIAYRDAGNSQYGTAVVGTISGTSISFGTPTVFDSAYTSYSSATFDSNSNKVVIAYQQDATSSRYGAAIVGTVSGTSISFGSAVVFESARTDWISATFDSTSNKVVISYSDFGNSSYGTAIVGTVSGTSISFGSPVIFEAASTTETSSTFDANLNKIVIAYADGGNSGYGTSAVLQAAPTNYTDFIGITAEAISDTATGAVNVYGGINEAQTGLTIGSDYYVQADGSLSTATSTVKVGKAISATTINMMDLT
jgi:hypothetical protein